MRFHFLTVAILVAAAAQADEGGINVIRRLEIREAEGGCVVEIAGTRPTLFTTSRIGDRLTLELADSKLNGTPSFLVAPAGVPVRHVYALAAAGKGNVRIVLYLASGAAAPEIGGEGGTLLLAFGTPLPTAAPPAPASGPREPGRSEPPQHRAPASATPTALARLDAGELADLREIAWLETAAASRMFVRATAPIRAKVRDGGGDLISIELLGVRSGEGLLKAPATTAPTSAIAQVEGVRRGDSYFIDVKLRQRAAYDLKVDGNTLALDFASCSPPTACRSAIAPPVSRAATGTGHGPSEATPL